MYSSDFPPILSDTLKLRFTPPLFLFFTYSFIPLVLLLYVLLFLIFFLSLVFLFLFLIFSLSSLIYVLLSLLSNTSRHIKTSIHSITLSPSLCLPSPLIPFFLHFSIRLCLTFLLPLVFLFLLLLLLHPFPVFISLHPVPRPLPLLFPLLVLLFMYSSP